MPNKLKSTIRNCREILSKPTFSKQDEIELLKSIQGFLQSTTGNHEYNQQKTELLEGLEELLLIKKYKLIYNRMVKEEELYFDSTGLLNKINHAVTNIN